MGDQRFDLDLLDEEDPFEVDVQAAYLFKHLHLGIDDVWASNPLFYPPAAHWLMCGGCYEASAGLAAQYRRDR